MKRALSAAFLISSVAFAQTGGPAPDTGVPTVGILNFIHAVNDLDQTLAFYRDVFGLSGDPRPFPNPGVPALTDSPGVSLRLAVLRIPNTGFGFELTQFSGVDRHPGMAHPYDPGSAFLLLRVKDIKPVVEAVKKRGDRIVTTSGEPVPLAKIPSIMMRDPDGFVVEAIEVPAPAGETIEGNILGAAIGLAIAGADSTKKFYHDLLGFDVKGRIEYHSNPAYFDMLGAPPAMVREFRANIPGATRALMAYYEYQGLEQKPFHLRVPDPGAPAMALRVTDIDGLLARMRAAGVKVDSAGGKIVQFTPTIRNIFVEDPNGFHIELFESKP